jgi:hypothetical protein
MNFLEELYSILWMEQFLTKFYYLVVVVVIIIAIYLEVKI